jgi:hypothetical protein
VSEADYYDDGPLGDDECPRCDGAGGYHDCGEDACCCADPEDEDSDDWVVCDECGGSGGL